MRTNGGTAIIFAATLLLLLSACDTFQPAVFAGGASKSRAETVDCAIGYANALGYTVMDANRDAGLLRAEKKTTGAGTMASVALLGSGANKYDEMLMSVYFDPLTKSNQIKITADTSNEPVTLWGGAQRRTSMQPSPTLISDAQRILSSCGGDAAVTPAKREALSRVTAANFARQMNTTAALVGAFDLSNDNDFAIMSPKVQCTIAGVTVTNTTPLPALGSHQHVRTPPITFFSAQQFPDGIPDCRVTDVTLP